MVLSETGKPWRNSRTGRTIPRNQGQRPGTVPSRGEDGYPAAPRLFPQDGLPNRPNGWANRPTERQKPRSGSIKRERCPPSGEGRKTWPRLRFPNLNVDILEGSAGCAPHLLFPMIEDTLMR